MLGFSFQPIIFISRGNFLHKPLGFCGLSLMRPAALHSVLLVKLFKKLGLLTDCFYPCAVWSKFHQKKGFKELISYVNDIPDQFVYS